MGATRSRLSYANIAATLAVVLALGTSTAYAAGLAKNSVKSSHIKNGQVKSVDVKDNDLTGQDVKADAITGQDVKESTLGQVPNASSLGGLPALRFPRTSLEPAQGFLEGAPLGVVVPGYGTFQLFCDNNDTASTLDDQVQYQRIDSLGVPGTTETTFLRSPSAGPAVVALVVGPVESVTFSLEDREKIDEVIRADDGSKVIRVTAIAWDDSSTVGCKGRIEADVLL